MIITRPTQLNAMTLLLLLGLLGLLLVLPMDLFNLMDPAMEMAGITSAAYWKQRAEKDTGGPTTNPNLIAARIIKRGGPVTAEDVNAVLAHQGHSVTQAELDELCAIPYITFTFPLVGAMYAEFLKLFPSKVPLGKGTWGIYMYINMITGAYYPGSSIVLHQRLRFYWKKFAKILNPRLIIADIRKYGLPNFTVRVFIFPDHLKEQRLLIALEQYYILSLNPANTSNLVAEGSPGGMHLSESNSEQASVPVFMYLKGVLLFVFSSTGGRYNSVLSVLGISEISVRRSIRDGYLFLDAFLFTLEPIDPTVEPSMTEEELVTYYTNYREEYDANKTGVLKASAAKKASAKTPAVKITRLSDGKVYKGDNYRATRTWAAANVGKTMATETLVYRIRTGIPLNGYLYEHWTDSDTVSD